MRGPCACPGPDALLLGAVQILPGDVDPDEDRHKAPSHRLIRPLSLQEGRLQAVLLITGFGR
jgi:hypothetical protein